ncbi:hypothetical protein BDR05DRAFT_953419 [Suillus weaverae]|nr:hypothetical protein BDR05DRAFT_953419 [Suillus weaverae]
MDPKTATTFGVLEQYHLLSFESKASTYEFYQGLACLSDNTDGVLTTEPGQCTVLCPACPQPGINLPEDWKDASSDKQWLYALFIGIDANFHLKWKLVSSDTIDPGINKGWSYFIEEKAYKAYLGDHKDQNQEVYHYGLPILLSNEVPWVVILNILYDIASPECGWANINPIKSSTKEMGPGSCLLANAIHERSDHQHKLIELEGCMQIEDISQWRDEVEAWEQDHTQPNPFKGAETQATVQLELTRIEATKLETGNNICLHADVPPSILISSGIDLEEQQQQLSFEIAVLSTHATDNQLAKVQQHINALHRKIDTWQDIQLLYMPFVSHLCASEESIHSPAEPTPVEAIHLWLPSTMLHYVQANDALKDIQNLLHL